MDYPEFQRGLANVRAIQRAAWSHAITIRVSELGEDRELSWNTATGVLMKLGSQRIVATAWHVIKKFVDIREHGGDAAVVLGNMPVLTPLSVHLDEHNDLIFLQVPPEAGDNLDAVPYVADGRWPTKRVTVGDDVLLCGFPAIFRRDAEEIEHGDLSFVGVVESVSESQFILLPHEREAMNLGRAAFPRANAFLGGLSGSPVFGLYQDGMHLVGIFSQGGQAMPAWIVRSLSHLPADFTGPPTMV